MFTCACTGSIACTARFASEGLHAQVHPSCFMPSAHTSPCSYNTIISACSKAGQPGAAARVYERMLVRAARSPAAADAMLQGPHAAVVGALAAAACPCYMHNAACRSLVDLPMQPFLVARAQQRLIPPLPCCSCGHRRMVCSPRAPPTPPSSLPLARQGRWRRRCECTRWVT